MEKVEELADFEQQLEALCQALLHADPDIQEIIQFGSLVYAPHLARDVDLLITTPVKKDMDAYWDALCDEALNVDLLIHEPGEHIGDCVAWGVCATGRVLYGNEETMREVREAMPVLSYDMARERFLNADQYLKDAHNAPTEFQRDGHYRTAFNALFDATRMAAMTHLNTEETRWGELRRGLPRPHAEEFRHIVNVFHVRYFYHAEYPRDDVEGEFRRWRHRVSRFIEALEQEE